MVNAVLKYVLLPSPSQNSLTTKRKPRSFLQGRQGIQGNVGTLWAVDKDTVRAAIEPEAEKLIAGIIGDTSTTVNDDPRSVELKDLESRVSTLEFLVSKLMQPADMSSGLTDQSSASRRRLR